MEELEVRINGMIVDATDVHTVASGTTPHGDVTANFSVGTGAWPMLYVIGSTVIGELGNQGPAAWRVIGLEQLDDTGVPRYRVKLRQLAPAPADPNLHLLYGTVYQSIMGRVRTRVLSDILEAKGIISKDEFADGFASVVRDDLVNLASEIVSTTDAEAMRERILMSIKSGDQDA